MNVVSFVLLTKKVKVLGCAGVKRGGGLVHHVHAIFSARSRSVVTHFRGRGTLGTCVSRVPFNVNVKTVSKMIPPRGGCCFISVYPSSSDLMSM